MSEHPGASWLTEEGKPAEVNQRALIPKVLARYPGEFTLFRELLQNSDDAQSTTVVIYFETATPIETGIDSPVLQYSDVVRWTFKNDGKVFEPKDWSRLARIAEGNPDPAKVGAFGVGFYCLFSVTDCPFVSSGGHGMQFYWKDGMDQLFVRQGDLPSEGTSHQWTIFDIPLREPGHMPPPIDFMQFLATSITFMTYLKDVSVFFNEHLIGRIKKFPELPTTVNLPIAMECVSPSKMVVVNRVQRHRFTIKAETSIEVREPPRKEIESGESFCPAGQPLLPRKTTTIQLQNIHPIRVYTAELHLTVFTAEVDVKVDDKFARDLIRCTAKKLPSRVRYSLVYTGKDDYDKSSASQETQALKSIFQGLHADLNRALHPRIFIGHSTSQTTGIGGHMESAFIPTVERESIDLVDRKIAIWNKELLYVGGFLSRAVYELELSAIQTSWEAEIGSGNASGSSSSLRSQDRLRKRFIHVLKFFTFHHSTPSQKVAELLQRSFYACSTSPLRFLSSVGVRSVTDIRKFDLLCDQFLKHVPMLSPDVTEVGKDIINALPAEHTIRTITLSDVLQELREHTLDEGQLIACLQWQIRRRSNDGMVELLQAARFSVVKGTDARLSSIQYFINSDGSGTHIPSDGPLPPSLIPRKIGQHFNSETLASFGWQEFTIVDWLKYISHPEIRSANPKHDYVQSIDWAEIVLRSVSSTWSFSDEIRHLAKSIFANEKCIPVIHGMCRPAESYLPSLNIPAFDDLCLPVVRFRSGRGISADMERFLIALGVQQHLPPQLLLTQMVEPGKWNASDLIDYLVQVAGTLSQEDISELKLLKAFPKEGVQRSRFCAGELYPPLDSFRQLHLPLIEWRERSKWQDTSPEAELLYRLGLRRQPSLEEIINLCSSPDAAIRMNAFTYFCANRRSVYLDYNPDNFRDIAFMPAENTGGPCLEKLGDVFLDDQWKIFGFSVVRYDIRWEDVIKELGVQRHPPSSVLLRLLETTPPPNEEIARRWFETLSEHISGFTQDELDKLSQVRMVPKTIPGDQALAYLAPGECYLGKSAKDDFYSKLFHFVNFGPLANRFLDACGAKNEPSEKDIAESLLDDPRRFYDFAKGSDRFLKELRELAVRHTRIPNDTLSKMMFKPVLLGIRRKKTTNPKERENSYPLWEPSEIVIVDDIDAYQLFDDSLIIAPRDVAPELEQFYAVLGCRRLSTVIREQCNGFSEVSDTTECSKFQALVLQRLPIFLHHYPHPQTRTSVSWSSSADCITVRLWERLAVSTTLTVGSKKALKERDAWATAKCDQEKIQLWLSRSAKKDMYEVAVSLCRVLFGTVNLSDALLLTTILSEDLDVLKRRGYEVDQVLKRQQCANDSGVTCSVNSCSSTVPETCNLPSTNLVVKPPVTEANSNSMTACAKTTTKPSGLLGGNVATQVSLATSFQLPVVVTNVVNNVRDAIRGVATWRAEPSGTSTAVLPPSPWAPRQVMPRSYIRCNVNKAIEACVNPRQRSLLRRHDQAELNKFLNEGYCDVTAPIGDLRFFGKMENVQVFVGHGIPDPNTFMKRMHESLSLFVRTITPIAEIYGLPVESIRIFYNTTAGCIAFNNKGILYFNLRYFEAWHYQDVKKGSPRRALSSWFLTFAHEIAHNLVAQYNSEHEFWFSAICEAHMDTFLQLCGPVAPVPDG